MSIEKEINEFLNKNYKLKKVPTFDEYNKMFTALVKYLKKERVDFKYALTLKDLTAAKLTLSKYESSSLGDSNMKKYLKNKYKKTFKTDGLNKVSVNEVSSFPIYSCMISDLRYCTENGYNNSIKYLFKNINLNAFDIDMVVMANAVKSSENLILKEIIDYLDEGNLYDGKDGYFTDKIKENINENLSNISLSLQDKLCKRLKWLKKPKFDEKKAALSESNNKEQEQKEKYKEMFSGLF